MSGYIYHYEDAKRTAVAEELRHRAVRIFQPTRSTTQSGPGKSNRWRIDWDILQGGGRWENPLMGWASSFAFDLQLDTIDAKVWNRADYMQGTRVSFRSKEDAIHFAEKQGLPPLRLRFPHLKSLMQAGTTTYNLHLSREYLLRTTRRTTSTSQTN